MKQGSSLYRNFFIVRKLMSRPERNVSTPSYQYQHQYQCEIEVITRMLHTISNVLFLSVANPNLCLRDIQYRCDLLLYLECFGTTLEILIVFSFVFTINFDEPPVGPFSAKNPGGCLSLVANSQRRTVVFRTLWCQDRKSVV